MSDRKHSDETKQILSDVNKEENNPMYGKNHTEETKIIMSEIKKAKPRAEGVLRRKSLSTNRSYWY